MPPLPVQVFGQRELEARLHQGLPVGSHLISVGNPRRFWKRAQEDERVPSLFRKRFRRILRLAFFDLPSTEFLQPGQPRRIPERSDVTRVRRFYEATRDEATGYVVHCWAGVSRSAALALGLLQLIHGDEDEAARELVRIRRTATPHPLLVQLWDQELGTELQARNGVIREERLREMRREILATVTRSSDAGQTGEELEELL